MFKSKTTGLQVAVVVLGQEGIDVLEIPPRPEGSSN